MHSLLSKKTAFVDNLLNLFVDFKCDVIKELKYVAEKAMLYCLVIFNKVSFIFMPLQRQVSFSSKILLLPILDKLSC